MFLLLPLYISFVLECTFGRIYRLTILASDDGMKHVKKHFPLRMAPRPSISPPTTQ